MERMGRKRGKGLRGVPCLTQHGKMGGEGRRGNDPLTQFSMLAGIEKSYVNRYTVLIVARGRMRALLFFDHTFTAR